MEETGGEVELVEGVETQVDLETERDHRQEELVEDHEEREELVEGEERDEVVAALAAEFKAGERERLSCWNAGRGSVCGVPFPGWEDWVREGRTWRSSGSAPWPRTRWGGTPPTLP